MSPSLKDQRGAGCLAARIGFTLAPHPVHCVHRLSPGGEVASGPQTSDLGPELSTPYLSSTLPARDVSKTNCAMAAASRKLGADHSRT